MKVNNYIMIVKGSARCRIWTHWFNDCHADGALALARRTLEKLKGDEVVVFRRPSNRTWFGVKSVMPCDVHLWEIKDGHFECTGCAATPERKNAKSRRIVPAAQATEE